MPRGEKICAWQVIADERTDGRTDHYRAPTERAPNKTTSIGRIDTVPQTGQISSLQILETVTFSSPLRLWLLNWPNIKRREMAQFGRNQKIEKTGAQLKREPLLVQHSHWRVSLCPLKDYCIVHDVLKQLIIERLLLFVFYFQNLIMTLKNCTIVCIEKINNV